MALPQQHRLKGAREVSRVFAGARPATSEHFGIRALHDRSGAGQKIAIVVPAKIVARATARNELRRRVSEIVAAIMKSSVLSSGVRTVISVRTQHIPEAPALRDELLSLMKKSGILHA